MKLAQPGDQDSSWSPPFASKREWAQRAYRLCANITRQHSRTFYLAASLLPAHRRPAIHALYAFCRVSDDIVDCGGQNAAAVLSAWREEVLAPQRRTDSLVTLAWKDTAIRYRIPRVYMEQLLDAVAQDLVVSRYRTFDDLALYCYGVAATVGLMAMRIIGYSNDNATESAIKLGVALQLTNILRDVGEDWRGGRLYLPLEELARFGLAERDIERGTVTSSWRSFMAFQIERARAFYTQSLPGIAQLNRAGRFAIAAAAELYGAILNEIEANDYDVFSRRAHVSSWGKLRRLPSIWLRSLSL
ncbi:MAG: phytoene/squalene synthase family protein [Anaerolineae bacterium]